MSRDRRLLGSIILLVSLTLALVGLSPATGPAQAGAEAPGRITGTVTGPGGELLEWASVSAYPVDCNGCDSHGAAVGADGSYSLDDLPPGTYRLLIQQGFDYIVEYFDNVTGDRAATDVVVAAGATVTGINARLETGGSLTGTVTGRGGRPVKGITVLAYRKEAGRWQSVGQESTTARDGSYEVTGDLLGGLYRLRFTDNREPGYLAEFYGGASTIKAAKDIVMGENETVTGLNAKLDWPRKLRVVKAPKVTGKPQGGATVRLFPGKWAPAKVKVVVHGWFAGNVYQYLDKRGRKIKLVGQTLARARGEFLLVRFAVSAPGYITVTRTLTVPGGPVTG